MWKPTTKEREELARLYEDSPIAVDQLPYTDEFEALYNRIGKNVTRNEVFRVLSNMRKRKELPRKPR